MTLPRTTLARAQAAHDAKESPHDCKESAGVEGCSVKKKKEQHSGSVYRFSTFQELVDRVPANRIADCVEELGLVLSKAKLSTECIFLLAQFMAKKDGKAFPSELPRIVLPSEFEWTDDGKGELKTRIVDSKGDTLFGINMKLNQSNQ